MAQSPVAGRQSTVGSRRQGELEGASSQCFGRCHASPFLVGRWVGERALAVSHPASQSHDGPIDFARPHLLAGLHRWATGRQSAVASRQSSNSCRAPLDNPPGVRYTPDSTAQTVVRRRWTMLHTCYRTQNDSTSLAFPGPSASGAGRPCPPSPPQVGRQRGKP
jgi:hypothetical protein